MATKQTMPPKPGKKLYPDLKTDKGAISRIAENMKNYRKDATEQEANAEFKASEGRGKIDMGHRR